MLPQRLPSPPPSPTRGEEGEAIGTPRQFARAHGHPPETVLRCAEEHDRAIVLKQQEDGPPVLILDAETLDAVTQCAAGA